jgi:LacI family transcriptional regulator
MLSGNGDTVTNKYIGIVLAEDYMFKRPYYGSILASIHEHAHDIDYHIRFIRVFDDFNNPALFNELIHPNEIGGVILLGLDQAISTAEDEILVAQMVERVERAVCVEWEWPGVPSIQFDRQDAAYQAAGHLAATGRKHIAYLGPDDKRVPGYRQALWEQGISPEDGLIYYAIDAEAGYEFCEKIIQSGRPLDAICAGTDEVAIGVLNGLHKHGLSVPDDIAVASIDNLDISAFLIPSLTTVDVPKYDIGLHAIDILTHEPPNRGGSAFVMTIPTRLIVRESSIPSQV